MLSLHAETEPQVLRKIGTFFRVESEIPWLVPYFDNPDILFWIYLGNADMIVLA